MYCFITTPLNLTLSKISQVPVILPIIIGTIIVSRSCVQYVHAAAIHIYTIFAKTKRSCMIG